MRSRRCSGGFIITTKTAEEFEIDLICPFFLSSQTNPRWSIRGRYFQVGRNDRGLRSPSLWPFMWDGLKRDWALKRCYVPRFCLNCPLGFQSKQVFRLIFLVKKYPLMCMRKKSDNHCTAGLGKIGWEGDFTPVVPLAILQKMWG